MKVKNPGVSTPVCFFLPGEKLHLDPPPPRHRFNVENCKNGKMRKIVPGPFPNPSTMKTRNKRLGTVLLIFVMRWWRDFFCFNQESLLFLCSFPLVFGNCCECCPSTLLVFNRQELSPSQTLFTRDIFLRYSIPIP